ncbi:MAG: right-handed parallel beta-helix repeat-containing protein [Myxococcales bacterium]|nr:right-handed parallel beta-helix repeat-containing protein [Myxococcales bacterium]
MPDCDGHPPASDALGTTPGELTTPFPTLEHVTLHWEIDGDSDEDGVATVHYRPVGGVWRIGPPLRRVPAGSNEGFAWVNKHAGSLFGLAPATTYEVRVHLLDPDGGCQVETREVTTRSVPEAMQGAPVIAVDPGSFAAAAAAAQPGDVLELAAGSYPSFTFPADGSPGAPIVLRAAGDVVINGDVRLDGRSHVIVEGLTVEGQIKFNAGVHLAIKRCTVHAVADGIAMLTRGENIYIADNVVEGPTTWSEAALGVNGDNLGEGIVVTGPGHVIEHNRVSGFRDAISLLEDGDAVDQFSVDILRNDISEAADDGVEADFCFHNCRIIENRLTNTFIALSSQPGLGGPTYFIRNSMYSVILSAFKLQRASVGDVLLHNTVVKNGDGFGIYTADVFSRQWARNNLFIGGPGGDFGGWSSGQGDVLRLEAADLATIDLDYDGYGSTLGAFTGRLGDLDFDSLAALQASGQEAHAIEVGLDVFAAAVPYPAAPFPALPIADLRLADVALAVDAGEVLPGINAEYAGQAPDLGAHELGAPLPHYGPR